MTAPVEKPCPMVPPVIVSYVYGSPVGWNAVLVGFLSCILALVFLLTCLYYMVFRRRYMNDTTDSPPVVLVEKSSTTIPVTCSSQTATTTFINETGKTEQASGSTAAGDMPSVSNGNPTPSMTNGLLTNGNTDPSELRLLQHEHH